MIYALEEAIEKNKNQTIGEYFYDINGFEIEVHIEEYSPGLKKISASSDGYSLDLVR